MAIRMPFDEGYRPFLRPESLGTLIGWLEGHILNKDGAIAEDYTAQKLIDDLRTILDASNARSCDVGIAFDALKNALGED